MIEWLFIEAEVDKNAIVIGTVYKPPDSNVNIFNEHFSDILRKFSNERKKCIIMADFNIDLLNTDTWSNNRLHSWHVCQCILPNYQ